MPHTLTCIRDSDAKILAVCALRPKKIYGDRALEKQEKAALFFARQRGNIVGYWLKNWGSLPGD